MDILSWAIIGALLGWSLGNIAVVVLILAGDLWNALRERIADLHWQIRKRHILRTWEREGKPAEVVVWEQQAAAAIRHMRAGLPTAEEAAAALARALQR